MDEFKPKNKETCSPKESESVRDGRMEAILEILKDKYEKSGGNCGLTLPKIKIRLESPPDNLKEIIDDLKRQDKITIHPGGQGDLIKIKADEL